MQLICLEPIASNIHLPIKVCCWFWFWPIIIRPKATTIRIGSVCSAVAIQKVSDFLWSRMKVFNFCFFRNRWTKRGCDIQNWFRHFIRNDVQNSDHRSSNTFTVFAAASQSTILSIHNGTRESTATSDTNSPNVVQCTRLHFAPHLYDVNRSVDSERRRRIQQKRSSNCEFPLSIRSLTLFIYDVTLILCIVLHRIYAISTGTRNVPYRKYHWAAF